MYLLVSNFGKFKVYIYLRTSILGFFFTKLNANVNNLFGDKWQCSTVLWNQRLELCQSTDKMINLEGKSSATWISIFILLLLCQHILNIGGWKQHEIFISLGSTGSNFPGKYIGPSQSYLLAWVLVLQNNIRTIYIGSHSNIN